MDDGTLSRRSFLTRLLALTAVLAGAELAAPIIRYAYPVVRTPIGQRQKVATVSQLTPLGKFVDFDYQEVPCTLLQLDDARYVALSRICTHLGCVVKWQGESRQFRCPCHAGYFTPTGEVISGPPPRPLPQLKIARVGQDLWVEGWQPAA